MLVSWKGSSNKCKNLSESWVALSFSSLSQNLLNFLLKKGVLFSYYVFLREAKIHFDQCSWAKRVQKDCYL